MPLSTTGLQEGDFTVLRVLKNGVMQDVLSLTATGSPDIPLGSLSIALTNGLQTQLNAKATTAALSAAAESLGAELDSVEAQVSALSDTLAAVGAAVDTKASTTSVNAVLTSLNSQYNTVSSLLCSEPGLRKHR
jgi:type VI protein secretion system component VasK